MFLVFFFFSQLCDPPVSVYKGHALPKDTEDYLASQGLKNAIYTIRATDLKDDMFGMLSPFSLQVRYHTIPCLFVIIYSLYYCVPSSLDLFFCQEPASISSDDLSPVVVVSS